MVAHIVGMTRLQPDPPFVYRGPNAVADPPPMPDRRAPSPPHPPTGDAEREHGVAPPAPGSTLRAIFDGAHQFVGLVSPDGTLLEANQTALDFAGATRDEVIGRPFWEAPWWATTGAETVDRLRQAIAEAARGNFVRYEVVVHGANGRRATIDFSLKPVTDQAGRVVCIIPEGHDITERRRAEDALRLSEAKLAGIVSLAAEAIVSVDESQRITLFNRSAEIIFGYTAEEVLGRPLEMLIPEQARAVHRAHVAHFGESTVPARRMGERRPIFGRRKDGTQFPAEASISRLDFGGQRMYTAVLRDVTERKQAEEEKARLLSREMAARTVAESAERRATFLAEAGALLDASLDYRATLSHLAQLVVPALATYCVVDVVEATGLRRVEVEHADPGRRALARELLRFPRDPMRPLATRPSLQTGRAQLAEVVDDAELRKLAYDADHLEILKLLAPRSYMDVPLVARGNVIGAIIFATDAASGRRYGPADLGLAEELARRAALSLDNARLYQEAQRATRQREEVLGIVSHDLRTPLSVVSMHTQALEQLDGDVPAAVREAATGLRESVDWLQRMIQDLLDVASIDAGRLRLERREQDPVLLLMHAVDLFEQQAGDAGLRLRCEVPDHLPTILADGDRVLQVLANLIGNAIKFTRPGGSVTVRATADADMVRISVADTGPGIAPENAARIFDRYWHDRGTAEVRGTGLGLAIAKGLVEAHGGRIWVESTLGAGSTFHVMLPVYHPPPVTAPDSPLRAGNDHHRGNRELAR